MRLPDQSDTPPLALHRHLPAVRWDAPTGRSRNANAFRRDAQAGPMTLSRLPEAWVVWNEEPEGRTIVTYRPDVFDSQAFPAPCLPTIYVTNGSQRRRPGAGQIATDTWYVKLFLEPEVEVSTTTYDSREDAIEGAVDLASRFGAGDVDYRAHYQVPREAYLDRLDELTGRDA